jgi:hypothetical protein
MSLVLLIILAVFHDGPKYIVVNAPSMSVCEAAKPALYDHYLKQAPLQLTIECHEVKPNPVT